MGALQREAQSHAAANWQRWGLVEEKVVEAPAGESEPDVVDADEPDGDDAPLRGDVRDESAHERAAPSGAGIMGDGASRDSHGRVGNRGRGTAPRRRSSSCSGGTGGRLGRGSGSEDETSSSSEETTRRNERRQQQPTQQSLALNGDSVAEPQFVFGAEPQVPLWQLVVHWLLAIGMRRLLEAFVLATEAPRGLPDLFNRGLFTPQTDTRVLLLTVLLIATADIPSVVTSGGDFIMRQFGYRYSWYSRRGEPVADLPEYVAVIVYIIGTCCCRLRVSHHGERH